MLGWHSQRKSTLESPEHARPASEDRLDWLHISDLNPDAYNNKFIGHDAVCRKQALSLLARHRALINGDGIFPALDSVLETSSIRATSVAYSVV